MVKGRRELREDEIVTALAERVRTWRWTPHDTFLREVAQTSGGAELLVREARDIDRPDRVLFIAALGDAPGSVGLELLRYVAAFDTTTDIRCAAIIALLNRQDPSAGDIAAAAFNDRSPAVRDYALLGLAIAGTDDRWDAAFERIKKQWRRPPKVGAKPIPRDVLLLCYLLEHASGRRLDLLSQEVQRSWSRIDPESVACIEEVWPTVRDAGGIESTRPDAREIRDWVIQNSWLLD